ncbi:MAG: guanosine monophosphate reductase [Candidatus Woesearchaeota archaeon]
MWKKKEKHIDDIIWEIFEEDQKTLGLTRGNVFTRNFTNNELYLESQQQKRATARGGFLIGQLVHLASMNEHMALTFDDIAGSPYRALASRQDADTTTYLTKDITLPMPIVSANMEDVTGPSMAIAMAQMGGLGIIHQFYTAKRQADKVHSVKIAPIKKINIDGREYTPSLAQDNSYLVGAAIGIHNGTEERVRRLIDAGVDILVVDIAHGHSDQMIRLIDQLKSIDSEIPVIAGNVAAPKGAYELCQAGADVIKVNVGSGAACTTRLITGYGVPEIKAIYETSLVAKKYGVKVMADGGIRTSGDLVKALAAGADTVMIGRLLAATNLSNNFKSRVVKKDKNKEPVLIRYSGSASEYSKHKQGRGSFDTPEGRTVYLHYGGDTYVTLAQLITGIQSGISYSGNSRNPEIDENANIARLQRKSRWTMQSVAGLYEGNKGSPSSK